MAPLPARSRWIQRAVARRRRLDWLGQERRGAGSLLRLADRGDHAVVLLDGHGPLAFKAAGHWAFRGHEGRLVYEPLDATDPVLCWHMVPRSSAHDPHRRHLEDAETRDDLVQVFLAPRDLLSVADRPWTKEWLEAAIALGLSQPRPEPLPSLLSAFRVGTAAYEWLLGNAEDAGVAAKFRALELIRRRNPVQYESLTGASRRLLEAVCGSEVIRLRARPGPFDWDQALRDRRLLAFDGGRVRSRELKRAFFLLASLEVIHAVRRHFAATQQPLPVVLVLEEAEAMGLLAEVDARLGELRRRRDELHIQLAACHENGNAWIEQVVRSFELIELLREAIMYASAGPRERLLRGLASNYSVEGRTLVWEPRSPFRQVGPKGGRPGWCPGLYDVRTEITETCRLLEAAYTALEQDRFLAAA